MKNLHEQLEALYLDWVNNFIGIESFANHYGLEKEHAIELIEAARKITTRSNIHK